MCTPVCRVCLAGDVGMHSIAHMELRGIYERLTRTNFSTEDGMPNTICHMCYWQLQRSRRFSETACRSQGILIELLRTGVQVTSDAIMQNMKFKQAKLTSPTLSVTPTLFWSINDQTNNESSPLTVNEKQVVVKEETMSENVKWIVIEEILQVDDVGVSGSSNIMEQSMEGSSETHNKTNKFKCFYCDVCNKSYTAKQSLVTRIRRHFPVNPCSKFNKTSKIKINKIKHMRFHTGDKPYACNRCEKTFSRKERLTIHMQFHTGEKPYACNRCKKTFLEKCSLTRHMRVHTGEKPYACNRCEKRFSHKYCLIKHMQVHTGEKPYACNRCEKTFLEKWPLIKHMRVHTGEKPYACNRCEKTFSEKGNLTRHIQVHTGEKRYACNRCKKTFSSEKYYLTRHMQVHTGEMP